MWIGLRICTHTSVRFHVLKPKRKCVPEPTVYAIHLLCGRGWSRVKKERENVMIGSMTSSVDI